MASIAIKAAFEFTDNKNLRLTDSSRLYLGMQLSTSGFSAAIMDRAKSQLLAFEQYDFYEGASFSAILPEFEVVFGQSELINTRVHSAGLAIDNEVATLIPNPLYNPSKNEEYLKSNFELTEDYHFASNALKNLKVHNVFGVPRVLYSFLYNKYNTSELFHSSTTFIDRQVFLNKANKNQKVIANIGKDSFQLLVFDGNALQLFNTFQFRHADDVVYFILFVMEQLNLDPHMIPLKLIGPVDRENPIMRRLKHYVQNIELEQYIPESHIPTELPQSVLNANYSLLNQFRCV